MKPAYISSSQAFTIDKLLLDSGYSIEQLVELAGLSIAQVIFHFYPPTLECYLKPVFIIGRDI